MLVASLVPAATAIAVAWLVGRVVDAAATSGSLGPVVAPLVVVGLLLTLDQVTQSLLVPFRDWMASRVNGEIRRTVRRAVSVQAGVEHLEDQAVRDAAALPVDNAYLFNLGAGAEGQLWLLTRFAGALAAALVVARASVPAAIATFVFVAWQRILLRRHYAEAIASGMVETTGDGRAANYWSEILGTQAGAKELRVFGFRSWALDRFTTHGSRPVDELAAGPARRPSPALDGVRAQRARGARALPAPGPTGGRRGHRPGRARGRARRRGGRGPRALGDGVGGVLHRGGGAAAGRGRADPGSGGCTAACGRSGRGRRRAGRRRRRPGHHVRAGVVHLSGSTTPVLATSISSSTRGGRLRWSVRTAPGRPPCSSCSPGSTARPRTILVDGAELADLETRAGGGGSR